MFMRLDMNTPSADVMGIFCGVFEMYINMTALDSRLVLEHSIWEIQSLCLAFIQRS